jgi:hypothetical protein
MMGVVERYDGSGGEMMGVVERDEGVRAEEGEGNARSYERFTPQKAIWPITTISQECRV